MHLGGGSRKFHLVQLSSFAVNWAAPHPKATNTVRHPGARVLDSAASSERQLALGRVRGRWGRNSLPLLPRSFAQHHHGGPSVRLL